MSEKEKLIDELKRYQKEQLVGAFSILTYMASEHRDYTMGDILEMILTITSDLAYGGGDDV